MKGYKVFNENWKCRGFQYKVGETYEHKGGIYLCESGFHFCKKLNNCFNYYSFNPKNKVAEIEAIGDIIEGEDKCVTNKIKILKEISWQDVLELANLGENNEGYRNVGNGNKGHYNTGDNNYGDYNTGDNNYGNENVGYDNFGNRNIGDMNFGSHNYGCNNFGNRNIGDYNKGKFNLGINNKGHNNAGNYNYGDYNFGDCNKTHNSLGCFCTESPSTIKFFNKDSDWTLDDWKNSNASRILLSNFILTEWIYAIDMTDEEKEKYPNYKTINGYLKIYTYEEAWKNMWSRLTNIQKKEFTKLPNFDKDIFKEITGIDI